MRTTIFTYKGIIGIHSGPDAEQLMAKPGGGNLGCVFNAKGVDISPEALELLKTIPPGRDSLGEVDVFQAGDETIVGWMGGYLKAFNPKNVETSREYNPSLLKSAEGVEIPEEFKQMVEQLIEEGMI